MWRTTLRPHLNRKKKVLWSVGYCKREVNNPGLLRLATPLWACQTIHRVAFAAACPTEGPGPLKPCCVLSLMDPLSGGISLGSGTWALQPDHLGSHPSSTMEKGGSVTLDISKPYHGHSNWPVGLWSSYMKWTPCLSLLRLSWRNAIDWVA